MREPVSVEAGLAALHDGQFQKAIDILEQFCQSSTAESRDLLRAKMHLVKTYESRGQISQATMLCQQLSACPNAQVQIWAEQRLKHLLKPASSPTMFDVKAGR